MTRSSNKLFIAVCLYLLAVSLRLYSISPPAPQTDEITWRDRCRKIVRLYHDGDYHRVTSYLGHPGIAPALIMAAGQAAGNRFNARFQREPGKRFYLDDLSSARAANAAFSSLLPPVVFLAAAGAIGAPAAALAGLLAATDVHEVGLSRIAHLDASLAVWTMLCLSAYFQAVRRKSFGWKITAGALWGVAVGAKASAVSLVFLFAAFKMLRLLIYPKSEDPGERALVTWSDIWAVLAGNAVLGLTYTRLWLHDSDFRLRFHIVSPLADLLYAAGQYLHHHQPLAWGLIVCSTAAAILARRCLADTASRTKAFLYRHLSHLAAAGACISLPLFLAPQVLENLVRFWLRVAGFRSMVHKAHGQTWAPPAMGYVDIILSRPSSVLLVLFFLALPFLLKTAIGARRIPALRDSVSFLLLMLAAVIIWPAVLGTSSKQAFRYVLPILAPAMVVAAWGALRAAAFLFHSLTGRREAPGLGFPAAAVFSVLAVYQLLMLWRISPDYVLFYNDLSGGLSAYVARGGHPWLAGANEALTLLRAEALGSKDKKLVAAIADKRTLQATYKRLFPGEVSPLSIYFAPDVESADFVFYIPALSKMAGNRCCTESESLKRIYAYSIDGVPLTELYRTQHRFYAQPHFRSLVHSMHRTGREAYVKDALNSAGLEANAKVFFAAPGHAVPDWVFFFERVHLKPGRTRWRLFAALPRGTDTAAFSPDAIALKWEIGKGCERSIRAGELESGVLRGIAAECSFTKDSSPEIRGYWPGTVPIVFSGLDVQHIEQAPVQPEG